MKPIDELTPEQEDYILEEARETQSPRDNRMVHVSHDETLEPKNQEICANCGFYEDQHPHGTNDPNGITCMKFKPQTQKGDFKTLWLNLIAEIQHEVEKDYNKKFKEFLRRLKEAQRKVLIQLLMEKSDLPCAAMERIIDTLSGFPEGDDGK